MFVRIKTTPNSPRKSVQIVESFRKGNNVSQKIIRHVGIAMDDVELKQLVDLAESIKNKLEADGQQILFSPEDVAAIKSKKEREELKGESDDDYNVNLKNITEEQRVVSGIHDIYGRLFDQLGYGSVMKNPARHVSSVNIYRDIVLARIANPISKRGSVDMLEKDFGVTINLDNVYKMMDKLDDRAIERLNEITYKNTIDLFQNKIDVIFFDCTTLYFEAFTEDSLRKNGFSKDLKFNQPQVLLALMVTKEGLPIGYKAFEGSKYEGHTLIPAVRELRDKYKIDKVVFVADAAMMNEDNLQEMEGEGIDYIVGSRLKNLPVNLQKKILNHDNYKEIRKGFTVGDFEYKGRRLIVSYSEIRARKDSADRRKAIERLEKKLSKIKNPKEYLTNYGYRKYLKIEGESTIKLNDDKIDADSKWDGLHGVITGVRDIGSEEILIQYNNLWQVENAFRITKHDLRVRPVFHWKPHRVKAHLAISFTSYALVKHLEYIVKLQYKKLSPEKIRQLLLRVQTSILYDKKKKIRYGLPSRISVDAKKIYRIFGLHNRLIPYIIKKM
ncbi:MAG: IS1634 family transposase [Gammaproteobacteria bacterium]|nr:IS1634 family transposase [Gammaproteobacteria bacterium]